MRSSAHSSNDGVLRLTVSVQVERSIASFEKQIGKANGRTLSCPVGREPRQPSGAALSVT